MPETKALAVRETRDPEVIRLELARSRQRFEVATAGLTHDLQWLASWREWVRRHPWLSLAGALVAGAAAGAVVGKLTARSNHGHQRDDAD